MFTFRVRPLALELLQSLDLRAGPHDTLNGKTVEFDMFVVFLYVVLSGLPIPMLIYIYICNIVSSFSNYEGMMRISVSMRICTNTSKLVME